MSKYSILFGKMIGHFLVEKGWKQADLIRATGIGNTQMSNYVKGKVPPNLETMVKIAAALNQPISDFFKEEITLLVKTEAEKPESSPLTTAEHRLLSTFRAMSEANKRALDHYIKIIEKQSGSQTNGVSKTIKKKPSV